MTVRDLRTARFDLLAPDGPRELLRRHLEIAMHQNDQRSAGMVLHHKRLNHLVLGHAQFTRRRARAAMLFVTVEVFGERHAGVA